ncbi:hypothetical protein VDGL01_01708, partial [Verticillium dahliae]
LSNERRIHGQLTSVSLSLRKPTNLCCRNGHSPNSFLSRIKGAISMPPTDTITRDHPECPSATNESSVARVRRRETHRSCTRYSSSDEARGKGQTEDRQNDRPTSQLQRGKQEAQVRETETNAVSPTLEPTSIRKLPSEILDDIFSLV